MAALSGLQSIYVYTHDSIFVGEDGPTHQPVEHLAVSRAIPNLNVIRPCDAEETREAWLAALAKKDGPTVLALSRQNLTVMERDEKSSAVNLHKGAYIIYGADNSDVIILSSGSEVGVSVEAAKLLEKESGIKARVVSFPCWELFDQESDAYKKLILPDNIKKVVVEAGIKMGWERYSGDKALFITIDEFGRSAPEAALADYFGFTPAKIAERVKKFLA